MAGEKRKQKISMMFHFTFYLGIEINLTSIIRKHQQAARNCFAFLSISRKNE